MTKKEKLFILTYMLFTSIGMLIMFIILFINISDVYNNTYQTLIDHRTMTCRISDISDDKQVIIECYPESIPANSDIINIM